MSIQFEAFLSVINNRNIIKIPAEASSLLPSRGMVVVTGTVNQFPLTALLEPDGNSSHWFELDDSLLTKIVISDKLPAQFDVEPADLWPEPDMPDDIMEAIEKADLLSEWNQVTTKAHWEWLRWIRSTANPATRQKRINVACSKLSHGDRRPCCFDTTRCTVTELSKSGKLLDV